MSDIEWTNESAIRLIDEYRKRPQLWESTNDLYRVQTAKYEAWSELAKLFDCDIADLRKKLNSIFASHRREKAKVRGGGRTTWFLYPHMKFLPNHIENDNSSETIVNKSERRKVQDSDDTTSDDQDDDDHEVLIKQEPVHEYIEPMTMYTRQKTHKSGRTRPIIKRVVKESATRSLDSKLIEALKLLRRSDLSRKKDECDSFGEYIAVSLRKHDERTQSMIKLAINNILYEREMKKYGAGHYTASNDINPLLLAEAGVNDDK